MNDPAPEQQRGEPRWDAPNQQVVRPDHSGPGTPPEGAGGSTAGTQTTLAAMSKAELVEEAKSREIDVDPAATKAELREALEG